MSLLFLLEELSFVDLFLHWQVDTQLPGFEFLDEILDLYKFSAFFGFLDKFGSELRFKPAFFVAFMRLMVLAGEQFVLQGEL